MNRTSNVSSINAICDICQISHGFSSADRHAIIVMVVITGIVLILCYIGVLWFAIRTRYTSDEKLLPVPVPENIYTNQAFNKNQEQEENIEMNVQNTNNIATTVATSSPAVIRVEDDAERF